MPVCEVCGRELTGRILHADGKDVCYRHYRQFKNFNEFKDTISRNIYDLNEIEIYGDVAHILLYDQYMIPYTYAIIDVEDVDKVKNIKWHCNHAGYAVNNGSKGRSTIFMHRLILGVDQPVDHINFNKLDNRKCNLRPISHSQNQMNNPNFKGYYTRSENKFQSYIKWQQVAVNLGVYDTEIEAMYARWYAEKLVFRKYASDKLEPNIPEYRKKEIRDHVDYCVEKLFIKLGNYPMIPI